MHCWRCLHVKTKYHCEKMSVQIIGQPKGRSLLVMLPAGCESLRKNSYMCCIIGQQTNVAVSNETNEDVRMYT